MITEVKSEKEIDRSIIFSLDDEEEALVGESFEQKIRERMTEDIKITAMVTVIPILVTFSIFAGIIGAFCTCWFAGVMNAVDLEYG